MFFADVDEFSVLVVPHPNGDVDGLFFFVFSANLDQLALTLKGIKDR